MGDATGILWTDHTFNPWRGCSRVSPGCRFCYAEALTKRTGLQLWGDGAERRRTAEAYWRGPLKWDRWAAEDGRPHLVFCGSLCDVFEPRRDLDLIRADLWDLIAQTPNLIWQLLTKRPENVYGMVPLRWVWENGVDWPPNVWIGTTVEDQQRAEERIPELLRVPAQTRFLSCEPLLGPVATPVARALGVDYGYVAQEWLPVPGYTAGIQWVIVGGESGPHHRPFELDDARDLRDVTGAARVPYFFKQVGGLHPGSGGHELDGQILQAFPAQAGDRADGGPMAVRERAKAERRAERAQAVEIRK